MSSRKKRTHAGEQHVGEGDDFMKLTPNNRRVRKGTNSSSGQKSTKLRSLQSTLSRRIRGRPATKSHLVERRCSNEKNCAAENKPSDEKNDMEEKRYAATKYYVMVKTPLGDMLLLDDNSGHEKETPTTGKRASTKKHQSKKQVSGKRHRVSEKSCSFENDRSAEKDIPIQRGDLNKKRRLTEKGRSTVEGGFGDRGSYGKRGRPIEKRQPAKKGLSTKKNMSPKKSYLDGRGPSMENHQQENDRSAKKLSCTEKGRQIDGDRSVKRGLSIEKDHPVGRGPPAKKSHIAEKGYSASKSRSAGRGRPIKSRRVEKVHSIDLVKWAWSRILAGEDSPTWRGPCIQISPIVEARSVERGKTAKERPSTAKDHPIGRSRPKKKSRPAEEGCSVERVKLARSVPFAGEDIPTGRDRHIRSHPAEEGRLLKRGYTVEKRPSTGKDHPTQRSQPKKKSRPAEEGCSVERVKLARSVPFADEDIPTVGDCHIRSRRAEKGRLLKRGYTVEKRPSTGKDHPTQRSRPKKKSRPAEEGCSVERVKLARSIPFAGEDIPTGRDRHIRSHPAEEGRLLKRGYTVEKRPSPGKDHPTRRSQPKKKSRPAEEGRLLKRGYTVEKRPSTGKDHPTQRGRPKKKSCPAEEGCSVERVKLARSVPFAGEDIPTGRDRHIRSHPAEEGRLLKRGYIVEKRPSTGKDHPTWRSRPQKKSSPTEDGQSEDSGPSDSRSGRGSLLKKSCSAEKHLPEERSCSLKKGHPAEKGLSSKRMHSAEKVHSQERGHPAKKNRQLSSKKGSTEKKFCSGQSIEFHDSYTDVESNTRENVCSVEKGHHSMVQGFHEETLSSGSMLTVPVQEHMTTPESRIGSATSQVAQVSHQNVAGAVTTGQHMLAANLVIGVELKWPQVLKACLVEDWDLVNNQRQLFQLPAEKNVDHILAKYVTFLMSQGESDNTVYSIVELLYTTREYFNKILGTQLLCQFEKPQYAEMLLAYPAIPISRIYGAPHLLRLLVNIGAELAHWSLSRQSLMLVSSYMHSFLNFLAENSTSLFSVSNYKMASAEYCFKAL